MTGTNGSVSRMNARNETVHDRNLELIQIWRSGTHGNIGQRRESERALHTLLEENSRLVWYWVNRSRWSAEQREDLYAAGMAGLLHGLERFDTERDCSVATYCTWWIRQAIGREASRHRERFETVSYHETMDDHDSRPREYADVREPIDDLVVEAVAVHTRAAGIFETLGTLSEAEQRIMRAWIDAHGNLRAAARVIGIPEGTARHLLYTSWSKLQHPSNEHSVVGEAWSGRDCHGMGWQAFFPGPGRVEPHDVCRNCAGREECLLYALEQAQLSGVWGGTSEHARKTMRRERGSAPSRR